MRKILILTLCLLQTQLAYSESIEVPYLGILNIKTDKIISECHRLAPEGESNICYKFKLYEKPDKNSNQLGFVAIEFMKRLQEASSKRAYLPNKFKWIVPSGEKINFEIDSFRIEKMPYYSHTFIDCQESWFKLPPNPFPIAVWIEHPEAKCDKNERYSELTQGQIKLLKDTKFTPANAKGPEIILKESAIIELDSIKDGYAYFKELANLTVLATLTVPNFLPKDDAGTQERFEKYKEKIKEETEIKLTEKEKLKLMNIAKLENLCKIRYKKDQLYKINLSEVLDKDQHINFQILTGRDFDYPGSRRTCRVPYGPLTYGTF